LENSINIYHKGSRVSASVNLPSSKSESNRALILKACTLNNAIVENLSEARDTRTLIKLLNSDEYTLDVLDAGTAMRFLTGYIALSGQKRIITGTDRMKQRPIGLLVEALRALGADIKYLGQDGYPPLSIEGFQYTGNNKLSIRGDISSQFISSLIMTAPLLPEGLELSLEGKTGSKPYIDMTLSLMNTFGVKGTWQGNTIVIPPQAYKPVRFSVESDWSAASYWYSIAALAKDAEIKLKGLRQSSLQGDRIMADIMPALGVETRFEEGGVVLTKGSAMNSLSYDFSDCPDIAQTIAVICAAKNIRLEMRGLESLRIKETDRIQALQNELHKFGHTLRSSDSETFILEPGTHAAHNQIVVETYEDHRMAMAFAPFGLITPIRIVDPEVVEKSYPRFWEDLVLAGFQISN
jgi:3-phosphoshikimate 1-carboxyvinyltransferase